MISQRLLRLAGAVCLPFLAIGTGQGAEADAVRQMVLHLPFDGTIDAAVGQELGSPTASNGPLTFVEGKHGQAVSLTGGAHVRVPLPPCVKEGEFSIAFWMKPLWHPEDDVPHPILDIPSHPTNRDDVGWAPGHFFISKGWSDTISPNYVYGVVDSGLAKMHLKPDTWVHIVTSYSGSGKFRASYINGEGWRRPDKDMHPLDAYQDTMWLGAREGLSDIADIVLDDLRVYNYVVEPSDVPGIAGVQFPPPRDQLMLGATCDPAKAVETPHEKWAKPYAGGAVRALWVGEGIRARDFLELAQRLDIEPRVVVGPGIAPHTLENPESFQRMGQQVEEHLRNDPPDCVIIGAFGWNLFPPSTRDALMAYVRGGGGLLFTAPQCVGGPGATINVGGGLVTGWESAPEGKAIEALVSRLDRRDEAYLTVTVPWQANTQFATMVAQGDPWTFFRGGRVGAGRVLLYELRSDGAYGRVSLTPALCWMAAFDPLDYDYALRVAGKALLWAARKDSPIRITSIRYGSDNTFFRQVPVGLRGGRWQVDVLNASTNPVKAVVRLRARTRGPNAPFVAEQAVTLPPGSSRVKLAHVMDRIGQVFGDITLLRDGKTADWATATAEAVHGNPWFTDLAADREFYAHGEAPRVRAGAALKTYGTHRGETGTVRWRLLDGYSRIVAQGEQAFPFTAYDQAPADVTWDLPALDNRSLTYTLAADLIRNGVATDQRVLTLNCLRQDVDDYLFMSFGGWGDVPGSLGTLLMRDRYGLDSMSVMLNDALTTGPDAVMSIARSSLTSLARHNLRPWIYATHLGGGYDAEKQRNVDLADPVFRGHLVERLEQVGKMGRPYSTLFYGLGDEVKIGPMEAAPSGFEMEAFRDHLRRRYGKLEALNAAWGTDYAYWRDIPGHSPEQVAEGKANLYAYNALRAFRDTEFAELARIGVDAVRRSDPGARVGIEGIFGLTHAWGNFDYAKLCRASTFMGQYALGMEMDMVRGLQDPGDLLGCWYNYTKLDPPYSRLGPWHVLLRGGHAFGWYTVFEGSHYTALNPDFTLFEQFAWTWEELEPLLAGIGKLVVGLERDNPGVYVLHEHRNLDRHSDGFRGMLAMTSILADLGLQHDFVSGRMVADGVLRHPDVKALCLPGQFVMEPDVAAAVRAYVEQGGLAIVDDNLAVSDGVRRYEERPLEAILADKPTLKGGLLPQADQDLADWQTHVKTVAKGASLYFGGVPKHYARDRMKAPGQLMRRVVGGFLGAHGVASRFAVRPLNAPFLPVDVVCYRDGASRYVALQRGYKIADSSAQSFEVTAPGAAHVYDVRAGKYLGHADKVTLPLDVARGALLAFLPYRATALKIEGLPETVRQGARLDLLLTVESEGETPAGGVFRVETRGPAGEREAPLCSKVRSIGGAARLSLPIAFNDPIGAWRLDVTDIATGTTAMRAFQVVP